MGVPGKILSFTPQRWLQVNLPPNLKGRAAAFGQHFSLDTKNQPQPSAKIWVTCPHTIPTCKLVTAIRTSLYGVSDSIKTTFNMLRLALRTNVYKLQRSNKLSRVTCKP